MKPPIKSSALFTASLIAFLSLVTLQPVYAASSFNSSSSVSFTLTSINNLTNPGDLNLTSLEAVGAFSLDNNSIVTSDAISHNYSSTALSSPVAVGDNFSQSLGVSGSVSNGNATAYFLATRDPLLSLDPNLSTLFFRNNSETDTYQIDLSFNYTLSANAGGDFADTDISLDFYSINSPSFSGFDSVYASAFLSPYSETKSDSVQVSLTLDPGAIEAFYTDIVMNGHIEASPVPVPGAVWLFISALISIPGIRKIKLNSAI